MSLTEHHIAYQHQGRFFTWGDPEKADQLLICLHGYGQLAAYFIRKFQALPENIYVVCPEGPHRFYQVGTAGRVGASWMTKEDRLVDIDNYIAFLDQVYDQQITRYQFKQKTLLGFSQGGATASRWIGMGNCSFNTFLLWAAVFPPDMDISTQVKFKALRNIFVIGTEDEYTSLEKAKSYHKLLNTTAMKFEFLTFEGKHNVEVELLKILIQ